MSAKRPTKKALIEEIVSEADDYDLDTLLEGFKDFWRDVLAKRTVKQLVAQAAMQRAGRDT